MSKPTKKTLKLTKEDKVQAAELKAALEALNAGQHNPINFLAVVRFLAPIIARIAARYAIRLINKKIQRKLGKKLIDETVANSAERIAAIAAKIALRKS